VQKAIRNIDQKELSKLVAQFQGHVLTMINDSSGNHVIQRCIQAQSLFAKEAEMAGDMETADEIMDQIQFIITDVIENIEQMSVHRYGCRVVQRSIEYCTEKQRNAVLEAITACNENIAEDLFGNYVVQQAIMTGTDMHREQILNTLTRKPGNIFRLSKQKYASNVVEKVSHATL
jgi:pumilio RNA-binding family